MAGWREQKRKALAQIHETFELPAVYLTHAAGTPVRVNVRLHLKPVVTDPNLDENGPVVLDQTNRIIFDTVEVATVLDRAYVIFGNSEAYLTGPSRPKREGYIYVEVSEVSQADLSALLGSIDTTGEAWEGIVS